MMVSEALGLSMDVELSFAREVVYWQERGLVVGGLIIQRYE